MSNANNEPIDLFSKSSEVDTTSSTCQTLIENINATTPDAAIHLIRSDGAEVLLFKSPSVATFVTPEAAVRIWSADSNDDIGLDLISADAVSNLIAVHQSELPEVSPPSTKWRSDPGSSATLSITAEGQQIPLNVRVAEYKFDGPSGQSQKESFYNRTVNPDNNALVQSRLAAAAFQSQKDKLPGIVLKIAKMDGKIK